MAGVSGGREMLEGRAAMARGAKSSRQAKPARRAIRNAFIVPVRERDCAGSGSAPDEFKLFKESCKPKWFLQKDGIGREFCFGKSFRITRHIDNPDIRVKFGDAASEFGAAQHRHDDVGQEYIQFAQMPFCDFQSMRSSPGFKHFV